MSEEEEQFQLSNTCKKLIENGDENFMDHCQIIRKFRGTAHWNCDINLQMPKNVPVIFHNLRGYDSHSICNDLENFDLNIDLIPNRLKRTWHFS